MNKIHRSGRIADKSFILTAILVAIAVLGILATADIPNLIRLMHGG